jgi:hypothetical protein
MEEGNTPVQAPIPGPTPTPTPEQTSEQALEPTPTATPGPTQRKPKTGLIIGIVIAVVAIIGIVVILVILLGGNNIKTIDQLKEALRNQEAVNCSMTYDGGIYVIQTTEGWSKIRMYDNTNGIEGETIVVKGDAVYASTKFGDYKTKYNGSHFDGIESGIEYEISKIEKSEIVLTCEPPYDFSVPDRAWEDISD